MDQTNGSTTVEAKACPACGCLCDDLALADGCALGRAGVAAPLDADRPAALIDGRPAALDEAIGRAAAILAAAKYPLVFGLTESTCEAQRVAVAITDRLGACIDFPSAPPAPLFPDLGTVTCTLGEVKNRADLLLFWGGRPAETHPRLADRYALAPPGRFAPNGRRDRTVIVAGNRSTADAYAAEVFLPVTPGEDFAALWLLRALVQGKPVDPALAPVAGVPLAEWQALADRLRRCQFGVLFLTRFYTIALRPPGNGVGAGQVLTWQTGYPAAVGLHRGYPCSFAGEFSAAAVLARGETDAALLVSSDPLGQLPPAAQDHLHRIPYVALSPQDTAMSRSAAVAITTAACADPAAGTVFRLDGLALPLRPAISSSSTDDFQVLKLIEQNLRGRSAPE
jgi:formylmethanofuran dehydrogenase subunit B